MSTTTAPLAPLLTRGGATAAAAVPPWEWRTPDGLEVSPQDDRAYRVVELGNGLIAVVVSDPDAEKAAAALSVDVGASRDPADLPGLAHFCEHMLFLGSKKYPAENHYKARACALAPRGRERGEHERARERTREIESVCGVIVFDQSRFG